MNEAKGLLYGTKEDDKAFVMIQKEFEKYLALKPHDIDNEDHDEPDFLKAVLYPQDWIITICDMALEGFKNNAKKMKDSNLTRFVKTIENIKNAAYKDLDPYGF